MHMVTSQVETVTVYRRGAQVTRLAEIPQPAQGWPRQLRLDNLPLAMLDNTLSARLEFPQGGGGLVARELRVELESRHKAEPTNPPELAQIHHELLALQKQLERLNGDIAKMQKLEPGTLVLRATQAPQGFPLRARRAVVELRQKTLGAWLPRRRQLEQRLEELQSRLYQAPASQVPVSLELSKSVLISLHSKPDAQASHLRLLLSYQVEGACWVPGYSLRFDRDCSLADLELRALVCQSSGEDWTNAKLSVSTAEPERWTEVPQLASRRLGRRQVQNTPGWRPLPPQSEALFSDYDGVPQTPRAIHREDFGPRPPYLSDLQIVAVALMSLPPEVSALLFKELSPDHVRELTLQVSQLPSIPPAEREAACGFVAGRGQNLELLVVRKSEVVVERFHQLLASQRPAVRERPSTRLEPVFQCRVSNDICDLMEDRSSGASSPRKPESIVEYRVGPLIPERSPLAGRRYSRELSQEQLAFDLLYLPGAGENERGKLLPQSPVEASLRRWKDRDSVPQARQILADAQRQGDQLLRKAPPLGYHPPGPVQSQDWLYPGQARVTIRGDCSYHSVPILRRQLPAVLHWLVVPKVTHDVFRRVELECPADLALPAGPVDLFVGSDYLACVELAPVAAGEAFLLDMGVETGVRVARRPTFQEQAAGLMGGTLQLRHEIHIEARNYLTRQVRLQVREPLPQASEGSDCKVRPESQWDSLEGGAGYFCWLSLPPGQRAECRFSYFIEMSNRLELVGGNRREK
ncbi:MAG: DUF4139 domain-containing protein [Candidatus Eremiobacteraeota bacterium]|nr:DUF4139 domain-containing protein [Candidatus Eremiobacteraeota bacterium]MCW5865928.1 DUF4139 domain-containing protein [Candidatus Eremiobacteraeota bacterium]